MASVVMRLVLCCAFLVCAYSSLSSQDIRDSWNPGFPVPGVLTDVWALATEGDDVAVLQEEGVRVFRDGGWSDPVALPLLSERMIDSWYWPVRNLALHRGMPWLVGDTMAFFLEAGKWTGVKLPPFHRSEDYHPELLTLDGTLYLTPDIHRWTGSGWERLLPDCFTDLREAVVSRSGRWFILGSAFDCGVEALSILEDGVLTPVDSQELWSIVNEPSLAFDGEHPIAFGHRYSDGAWRPLLYPEEWNPRDGRRIVYPNVGNDHLYAVSPGWGTLLPGEVRPGENILYRLEGDEWRAVSGAIEGAVICMAITGKGDVVIGGGFLTDGDKLNAQRVARFDGSSWFTYDERSSVPTSGIGGNVNDVLFFGDRTWVGGVNMYTTSSPEPTSMLYLQGDRWHNVEGIDGRIDHLARYGGALFVAGGLFLDGKSIHLARYRNGSFSEVPHPAGWVRELKTRNGSLYFSDVDRTLRDTVRSSLYRMTGTSVDTIISRFQGSISTFEIASNGVVYLGVDGGKVIKYDAGVSSEIGRVRGNRELWSSHQRSTQLTPSVHALLWHDGSLYVGGQFDSVEGVPAGNVARYDGIGWESLDSGFSRRERYYENVHGLNIYDRVSELHVVDGEILAGGAFGSIGTHSLLNESGGEPVTVPLALYNLSQKRWRPATHYDSTRRHEIADVRGVDVVDGRIAIAGNFLVPSDIGSWNFALSGTTLSVENEVSEGREDDPPFLLLYEEGALHVVSRERQILFVELFDITGRRVAELFSGEIAPGRHFIAAIESIAHGRHIVVARDANGDRRVVTVLLR